MNSAQIRRQLARLDEFLLDAYEPRELVCLLERLFGPTTTADLPHAADSPREFVFAAVRVLARRGLVDGGLLRALIADRPHRAGEIRRLAGPLGVTLHVDEQQAVTVVWRGDESVMRLRWVAELEKHLLARERLGFDDPGRAALEGSIEGLARRLRAAPPLAVGSVVASTRLEGVLGAGSFGTVWRARHVETNRTVATKIFNVDHLAQGIMLWRFRRSVRALQTLNAYRGAPPSIPPILEVAADSLAFVMPLFPEGTLENVARRGWSIDTKIEVFLQVCQAAHFAHRVGVVHRDIKPANVLLDESRRPVLVDYDIADISFVTELSIAEGGLGTPVFAAPEQLESAELADERSDVYSLGRLLHYLLIERSPGYQIERDPTLQNLRGHHPALIAAIRRATQWEPKRRHASVRQLITDVERYRTGVAALRARCNAGWRWVRHHAALLTTCATMTGASSLVAVQEREIAATNRQMIELAKERLAETSSALTQLQEGMQQYRDVSAEFQELVRGLEEIPQLEALGRADSELGQKLKHTRDKMNDLSTRLSKVGQRLEDDLGKVAEEQRELHRALGEEAPPSAPPVKEPATLAAVPEPSDKQGRPRVQEAEGSVANVASAGEDSIEPEAPKGGAAGALGEKKKSKGGNRGTKARQKVDFTKVMDGIHGRLLECLDRPFEDRWARLVIRVDIRADGSVEKVESSPRKLRPESMSCIRDLISPLKFGRKKDRYDYDLVGTDT